MSLQKSYKAEWEGRSPLRRDAHVLRRPLEWLSSPGAKAEEDKAQKTVGYKFGCKIGGPWAPQPTSRSQEPRSVHTIPFKIKQQRDGTLKHKYSKEQIKIEAAIRKMKVKIDTWTVELLNFL